ncbi:SIP domain-containing protein [Brevibacterium sp. 5221]|uniref:SIP domain-containing protein n=1 Tax=Brevibacterium rongguiense TaxID=2695267 RepID=A0A6N9H8M8_9MICO|nr:SIP domain-containing protein [Brevibacterium rongguiense]MYM20440.1 SIP domain-containing protein [Brevibacterium rongguiense]
MANWQRGVLRAMGATAYPATVVGTEDFEPWYRRIRFAGPEFLGAADVQPTTWMRLWVPNEARQDMSQRGYTFIGADPAAGTFDIDFVLHETPGPAGDFAKRARPGDPVEAMPSKNGLKAPADVGRFILVGDSTALPAIMTIVEHAAAHRPDAAITVLIEDEHPEPSGIPLPAHPNMAWRWLRLDGAERGTLAAAALRELNVSRDRAFAWAAGERRLVRAAKTVFKDVYRLDRTRQHAQNYWIEGVAGR